MNEEATRWPLAWPTGWKRTPAHQRQRSRFAKRSDGQYRHLRELTFSEARRRLDEELRRLDARGTILSSNLRVRDDGGIRADAGGDKAISDPGVAVYFTLKGQARCLACDGYLTPAGNIAAIAAHIDAIRAMDRYGVGTLDQAFAGYAPRLQSAAFEWWIVLGLSRSATRAQVDEAFTRLARAAHPDAGGTHADMARLTEARTAAYAEVR